MKKKGMIMPLRMACPKETPRRTCLLDLMERKQEVREIIETI